jgi:hypothetical protein
MNQRTRPKVTLPTALALGAGMASALVIAGVGSAPAANATCASFFGIGNSTQCSSTITSIAIAIGDNAEAHADGLLGAAVVIGNSSTARTDKGGLLNLAVTLNDNNSTSAGGALSVALVGDSVNTQAVAGSGPVTDGNLLNVAVGLTSPGTTKVVAGGIGNFAVDFVGSGTIGNIGHVSVGTFTANFVGVNANLTNLGVLNSVTNVLADDTTITTDHLGTGAIGSLAFNTLGQGNKVETSGLLAVSGSVAQSGKVVTQDGFGFNINGFGTGRRAGKAVVKAASPATASPSATNAATRPSRGKQGSR